MSIERTAPSTCRLPTRRARRVAPSLDRETQHALRLYIRRLEWWEERNVRDSMHTDRGVAGSLRAADLQWVGQMIERRARLLA
jgi:hypothetical protein